MEDGDAAQRLAHLGDDAWRREQHAPSLLRIVKGDERLGLRGLSPPQVPEKDANVEAAELMAQLAAHPLDAEARERLALLYADRLGRFDQAVVELELLVVQPMQSARSVARWLHLLADIHIRCAGDEAAARRALGRVVELFSDSAVAANAQARLDHLKLEMRRRDAARVLGSRPV
jgi:hypothetical protein